MEYELIDVEKLSTILVEQAWKEETKNVSVDDLYEDDKTVRSY